MAPVNMRLQAASLQVAGEPREGSALVCTDHRLDTKNDFWEKLVVHIIKPVHIWRTYSTQQNGSLLLYFHEIY